MDLRTNAHVGSVSGFQEPQGIAFVPTLKQAAVANGEGTGITWLSADGKAGRSITLGDGTDNVRWG